MAKSRIGRLYKLKKAPELRQRIGRLYPSRLLREELRGHKGQNRH